MGIISALGRGCGATLSALRGGVPGIGEMRYLDSIHREFPVGEVGYSDGELCAMAGVGAGEISTRTSLLGMIALGEALDGAGLQDREGLRIAFVSGTTVGGMDKSERYYADFLENDTRNGYIASHDCGACTEMTASRFGGFSLVTTISTACSSAANAIILGADMIRSGRADIVVAGGSECLTRFHLNGFRTLMILDREPCRPFDRDRGGINLGEGAAYVVLESAESAAGRGAKPLCRLAGYANTCDAFHQTASSPDGKGAYMAMKQALAEAGLQPGDIDYINAHGTGTGNNDLSEGIAIMKLFGDAVPPVSSTKPFTGHTTSAAGGVEAVISIMALREGFIPVNLNFRNRIGELSFSPATTQEPPRELRHVLSNSFGFGGNDSALIFSTI